jgi:hypothetical protein
MLGPRYGVLVAVGARDRDVRGTFYPRFDAVVLLSAPAEVILGRVAACDTNNYGKTGRAARPDRPPPGHVGEVVGALERITGTVTHRPAEHSDNRKRR